MTERRRLTLKDKLEIMVRQSVCPLCGSKLGSLAGVEFDHAHALARGGEDSVENLRAVHIDCHAVKTNGTGATSLGSDKHEIAKTRRLASEQEQFRAQLLAKEPGKPRQAKSKWPKRPMRNAKKEARG